MTLVIKKPTGGKLLFKKDSVIATDVNIRDVSLLLHGDGTNGSTAITDSSPAPQTVTANGNAQISTTQSKFGGASIAFDGNGDWLSIPANQGFQFGTNDFTVELQAYFTNSRTNSCILDFRAVLNGAGLILRQGSESSDPLLVTALVGGLGPTSEVVGPSIALNQWQHIAVVRSSGWARIYVNGVSGSPKSMTADLSQSNCLIGRFIDTGSSPYAFSGYMDELRITKGVARYTSNFTPPTAPFPNF